MNTIKNFDKIVVLFEDLYKHKVILLSAATDHMYTTVECIKCNYEFNLDFRKIDDKFARILNFVSFNDEFYYRIKANSITEFNLLSLTCEELIIKGIIE